MPQGYGFIGAGQMARALARGFCAAGLIRANQLTFFDPSHTAQQEFLGEVDGAQVAKSNQEVVERTDVVILAVKPQLFPAVAAELSACEDLAREPRSKLFISILAGIPLSALATGLGSDRVIRVMPNTPCLVGAGAAAFARGPGATGDDAELAQKLLDAVGIAIPLEERLLDAVTGLSGSGPAYVYTMIEALSDGGVNQGLPRSAATLLAAQTVLGAARMVLETGGHPGQLKDQVTSPAGTTIRGLQVLEQQNFRGTLIDAVEAATQRSQELGRTRSS